LNVLPAMVTVPVREVVPEYDGALSVTVPPPEPLAPAVTVIHPTLLVDVQVQPIGAVTVTLPLPPAAANV
jgi:hypothetical protein